MTDVIVGFVALIVGAAAGFLIRANVAQSSARTVEAQAQQKLVQADQKVVQADQEAAQTLRRSLEEAKAESAQIRKEAEEDVRSRREEIARLERRIQQAEDEISSRTQKLDVRAAELEERDHKLADVRARLEKAAEQHRAQLERVAGMTSGEAREQLVGEVVDDAKRSAMAQVREIEQRAREEGEERARKIVDDRDPAGLLGADRRVHGERLQPPERGHEGSDHRSRGPEHPGVRGDDRCQPDHRRHARGRGAVLVRPG